MAFFDIVLVANNKLNKFKFTVKIVQLVDHVCTVIPFVYLSVCPSVCVSICMYVHIPCHVGLWDVACDHVVMQGSSIKDGRTFLVILIQGDFHPVAGGVRDRFSLYSPISAIGVVMGF